ncbi:MAG: hypothetical protein IT164_20215 [Bryobacterales bacterium]|nr:hypothetical protein [Bryobacterales bacterium]
MKKRAITGVLLCILAFAGFGYAGWRYVASRDSQTCRACSRPIHDHTRTIAVLDGKTGYYCCPACALSEHQQAGKPVQITQLTDYLSGKPLAPDGAYVVRDSEVNPCARKEAALAPDKHPMHTLFDRCSPGILAFRGRRQAEAFAAEHGGQVLPFAQLASGYQH